MGMQMNHQSHSHLRLLFAGEQSCKRFAEGLDRGFVKKTTPPLS
jgi:hypothetical protein